MASYRIESLLGAWFESSADKAAVLQAALQLGEGAPNPEEFLGNYRQRRMAAAGRS